MKQYWPTQAVTFQESVAAALSGLGDTQFARQCEEHPEHRATLEPTIRALGLDELDPAAGPIEAAAAALAMRVAGSVVCPWPLVAQLSVPTDLRTRFDAVYLTDGEPSRLEHLDLAGRALAIDVRTRESRSIVGGTKPNRVLLDPFGVECKRGRLVDVDPRGIIETATVLTSFWVLGALDRVVAQVCSYAQERVQFGKPIIAFGAIQWRISDLMVAHGSLNELAAFTLMRYSLGQASLADVFALRFAVLDSGHNAFTNAHQILGAIGLCEEHDVTLLNRHLQPSFRRPTGLTATVSMLTAAIGECGFDAIRPISPALQRRLDGVTR